MRALGAMSSIRPEDRISLCRRRWGELLATVYLSSFLAYSSLQSPVPDVAISLSDLPIPSPSFSSYAEHHQNAQILS